MSEKLDRILREKDRALQRKMIRKLRTSGEEVYLTLEDWSSKYCNSLVASCVTNLEVRNVTHCSPLGTFPYFFRNPQTLYLENNSIEDLGPLCNLTHLTHLYLENNSVSDLSPLDTLVQNGLTIFK